MKINNINSTNFNGIYRIKSTPQNIQALEEHVLPDYQFLRKREVSCFVGTNPFKKNLTSLINHIAQSNKVSVDVVKKDAKKRGLDISDLGDDIIYIITGDKDNDAYNTFLLQRFNQQHETFMQGMSFIAFARPKLKLPEYLNEILGFIVIDEQENMAFKKFAGKVKEAETPKELFSMLLQEK